MNFNLFKFALPPAINISRQDLLEIPSYKSNEFLDFNINLGEYDFLNKFRSLDEIFEIQEEETENIKLDTSNYKYVGYNLFSKAYDKVELEIPEAKKYRLLLTLIAKHESGFNSFAKNPNAPAYGYFQFMLDGEKYNNIKTYANVSIEEFKQNQELLIKSAIKLAQKFENSFTEEDFKKAKSKGISLSGMIGGAWLGGIGGVRKVLNGTGNPSDRHWNKNGKGSDVASCIRRYNNLI